MATIDTESGAKWVAEAWERKSGSLDLRDVVKEDHRDIALASLVGFVAAGLMLGVSVDAGAGGNLAGAALGFALSGGFGWFGLDSLDLLDCELREDHECRRCRKKTERWEANGEENR
jgi:hypothetical protein